MTGIDALRALAAALLIASAAHAQPGLPPGVRGPAAGAATRAVSHYLDLERNLQDALAARDRAAAKTLLADDFEARTASDRDALNSDDWLHRESAAPGPRRVRELAVREVDDVAVVSFLLQAQGRARRAPALFVIDVWRRSTGKLLARYYESPAHPPALADRPSGRE